MINKKLWLVYLLIPYYWLRATITRKLFKNSKNISQELQLYTKRYLWAINKKVIIHGQQPSSDQTCIYISNHQSHNDIFIAIFSINRLFRFIAKKELFRFPTGSFLKMSNSYPLDRDDPRQSLKLLKKAVEDSNNGHSIFVFPEGTRSNQIEMADFKDGMFSVFKRASVPIVPMYIQNSFDNNLKEYHVYFGKAILPKDYNKLKGTELSELAKERIIQLQENSK